VLVATEEAPKPLRAFTGCALAFSCVLLPGLTIFVELTTGMCAEEFFDPLPTPLHLLLCLLVPTAGVVALAAADGGAFGRKTWLVAGLLGAAVAVSGVYSLLFLPLLPAAVFAIVPMGMGLLPLTPYFAFFGLLGLVARLHPKVAARERTFWTSLLIGGVVAVAAFVAAELPTALTTVEVRKALSEDLAVRDAALRKLRRRGHEETLRLLCTRGGRGTPSLLRAFERDPLPRTPRVELDRLYYRVTGRANEKYDRFSWLGSRENDFTTGFDPLQGTDEPGPVLRGLSLGSSRLDGIVDGHCAVAYVEWTLELENGSELEREARAVIGVPEGGVVSRLSLRIDGEERDAAFGGRAQTSAAYERVVRRRRDPATVKTAGRDAVLLRCFPIQAHRTMRVRVGVTVPLAIEESDEEGTRLSLELPALREANFASAAAHAVWLESVDPLSDPSGELVVDEDPKAGRVLRGELALPLGDAVGHSIACLGPSPLPQVQAADYAEPSSFVVQRIERERKAPATSLAVVIDGSASMEPHREQCIEVLEALDPALEVQIVIVSEDGPEELRDRAAAIERLRALTFLGGLDCAPALVEAWELVHATPGSAVLWLHGFQPVTLGSEAPLLQRMERGADGPTLVSCGLAGGTHRLVQELSELPASRFEVLSPARVVEWAREAHRAVDVFVRRFERLEEEPAGVRAGTDHVVRLWAAEAVDALRTDDREEAAALAARYRLVTPVSGAVVLETSEQYEQAGLDPDASPNAVPTVPEPGVWLLLAVAVAALVWTRRRRARGARA